VNRKFGSLPLRRRAILMNAGARMPIIGRLLLAVVVGLVVPRLVVAQLATRVSVGPGGAQGDGASSNPAISADGRWVAFVSWAGTLVPGSLTGVDRLFVHDRHTGTTAPVTPWGIDDPPAISADGRWVAFGGSLGEDDTNGYEDVFVHDTHTATTTRVSVGPGGIEGDGNSRRAAISADGRWIAFESWASNLVASDTNGVSDVFVHDRYTTTTTRVSVGPRGAQGNSGSTHPAISADSRWVAFASFATNLVADDAPPGDVYLHDRYSRTTTKVSVGLGGAAANGESDLPAISADGRWVAFQSTASNLVANDTHGTDVFVHDRDTGTTTRVSVGLMGAQGNNVSEEAAISADGRWVAFQSWASNLVAGDTNETSDVFVYDRETGTTTRVSAAPGGAQGNGGSTLPTVSADGRSVAFGSIASNLTADADDTNGMYDVFVHDRGNGGCAITIAPMATKAPGVGGGGTAVVLGSTGCAWAAASNDPSWLTVTSGAIGAGYGTVDYHVAANAEEPRAGTITIGGQTLSVSQVGATTPEPPEGLFAHTVEGNIVTLRWTVPSVGPAPTSFVLEGGVQPGQVLASLTTGSVAPTYTFTAPNGSFYVRMHALNGALRSHASNEIRIHVNRPVAPSPPAHLLALVNGSNVALAWKNTYEGGAPTSFVLDVLNPRAIPFLTSIPLGSGDSVTFAGVPNETYSVSLRAQNAGGSSQPTVFVPVTVPGPCSGPPQVTPDILAYRVGRTVYVDWGLATGGAAPTRYALHVTGSLIGRFVTNGRVLSGTVTPGTYTLTVVAVNACGESPPTPPQTVVVP
jgi:Tol biopolymer transport system component